MVAAASIHILVVSDDAAAASFILETVASMARYTASHVTMAALLGLGDRVTDNFDMIVMDVDAGNELERPELAAFRARFRDVPMVVISDQLSDSQMRQLFRLNGKDWIRKPIDRRSLIDLISSHAPVTMSDNARVHAVVSAVGGAGASVIAASLARVLAKPVKKVTPRVNLFDLDFSSGAQGLYLDQQNDYDLMQLIANPSRVDLEFIDLVKKRHASGFSVLSFKQPYLNMSAKGSELVLRMLDVIAFDSDHTVVDIPYYDAPWKYDVLGSVNSIFIVTELTVPALRQARDVLTQLVNLRGNNDNIYIVVNKYRTKLFGLGVRKLQVGKIFKNAGAHFIGDDWEVLSEALNRGILPFDVNPRSKFCSAVEKLGVLVK